MGRLFSCFVLFFLCKSDGSFHLIAGMSNCRLDVTALEISGSDFLQSLKGQLTPQCQMFTFDLHHIIIYIFFLFEVVFVIGAFSPTTKLYPPTCHSAEEGLWILSNQVMISIVFKREQTFQEPFFSFSNTWQLKPRLSIFPILT